MCQIGAIPLSYIPALEGTIEVTYEKIETTELGSGGRELTFVQYLLYIQGLHPAEQVLVIPF
jgi:hypothetical protein